MGHDAASTSGKSQVIAGVVEPLGLCIVKSGQATEWTFRFAFELWQDKLGVVHPEKLTVGRTVPDAELKSCQERVDVKGCEIVWVRARLTGPDAADLIEVLPPQVGVTAALEARRQELLTPKTRNHPTFGDLTLNRELSWYEGRGWWEDSEVEICLHAVTDREFEESLKTAEALWRDQSGWGQRVRQVAVSKLLDLKNSTWRDEGEKKLTPAGFARRLRLESVSVQPDGSFEFWFDDGGLFQGHAIAVTGSLKDGPKDADIHG
jgi:hypothetical protein